MNFLKLLLYVCVVLFAAVGITVLFSGDKAAVDDNYLRSEEFKRMEERLEKERSGSVQGLESYIDVIRREDRFTELTLPYTLDSTRILQLMAENRVDSGEGSRSFEGRQYYPVGVIPGEPVDIVLVLSGKPGIYRNLECLLVTVQGDSLVDRVSAGRYKKTLAESITTDIRIDPTGGIETKVSRIIFYPIRQEQVDYFRYTVSSSGTIRVRKQ